MSRSDIGRHWLFVIKNVLSFKRNLAELLKIATLLTKVLNPKHNRCGKIAVVDIESCHSLPFRLDGSSPEGKTSSTHETGAVGR